MARRPKIKLAESRMPGTAVHVREMQYIGELKSLPAGGDTPVVMGEFIDPVKAPCAYQLKEHGQITDESKVPTFLDIVILSTELFQKAYYPNISRDFKHPKTKHLTEFFAKKLEKFSGSEKTALKLIFIEMWECLTDDKIVLTNVACSSSIIVQPSVLMLCLKDAERDNSDKCDDIRAYPCWFDENNFYLWLGNNSVTDIKGRYSYTCNSIERTNFRPATPEEIQIFMDEYTPNMYKSELRKILLKDED